MTAIKETVMLCDFTPMLCDPFGMDTLRSIYGNPHGQAFTNGVKKYYLNCLVVAINRQEKKLILIRVGPKLLEYKS